MISFVVPVHNGERYLRDCIDSLFTQEGAEVEVVAVDDASTDNSLAILEEYGNRIKLIQQPNRGVSIARNNGFAATTGELITFVDQDDWLQPNYSVKMSARLTADPAAGAVYCDAAVHAQGQSWTVSEGDFTGQMFLGLLEGKCFVSPGAVMLRRSAFEALGGFDPTLSNKGEDLDLWLKLAKLVKWTYCPEPLFNWRKHDANQSNKLIKMYLGIRHILERHLQLNRPAFVTDADIARAIKISRRGTAASIRHSVRLAIEGGVPKSTAIKQALKEVRQAPELLPYLLRRWS